MSIVIIELVKIGLVILLIYFASVLFGCYLKKRFKLNAFSFAFPLGFAAWIFIFQMLAYIPQAFHFPVYWLLICLILSLGVILFLSRHSFKDAWKEMLSRRSFLLLAFIGLTSLVFYSNEMIISNCFTGDGVFYFGMIKENSDFSHLINFNDPSTGIAGKNVHALYVYSGVIHFYAILRAIFNADLVSFSVWVVFIVNHAAGFCNFYNIVNTLVSDVPNSYKNKHQLLWISGLIMLIPSLIGPGLEYGFYPTYLRDYSLMTVMILFSLFQYVRSGESKWCISYHIFTGCALATQSTQLFISLILCVLYYTYELFFHNKQNLLFHLRFQFVVAVYLVFFLMVKYSMTATLIVLACYWTLYAVSYYHQNRYHRFYKVLMIVLFVGLACAGFLVKYPVVTSSVFIDDVLTSFLDFSSLQTACTSCLILGCIIHSFYRLVQGSKEMHHAMPWLFLLVLNPLTIPFVSTYMTGSVYERSFVLFWNEMYVLLELVSFDFSLNRKCSLSLTKYMVGSLFCILSCLFSLAYILEKTDFEELDYINSVSRVGKEAYEIGLFLDEFFHDQEYVVALYPASLSNIRYTSETVVSSVLQLNLKELRKYVDKTIEWDKMDQYTEKEKIQFFLSYQPKNYTDWCYQFQKENVLNISEILLNSDVDVIVIQDVEENLESMEMYYTVLNQIGLEIYDNDRYQVYQIFR